MSYSIKDPTFESHSVSRGMLKISRIQRYWWVVLFMMLSFAVYAHAIQKKRQATYALETYLYSLEKEKEGLLKETEDLLLNINSQSDPAWIELTLMKGLGLVPEGKIKVYFDTETAFENSFP